MSATEKPLLCKKAGEDMEAVVDRIEGKIAMLEIAGEMKPVPLTSLPDGVEEGDVLTLADGKWEINHLARNLRQESNERRLMRLFGKIQQE